VNRARPGWLDSAWRVTAIYTLVTLATTWPLALRLTTSVPSDLGDPLLNCFILEWGAEHVLALAGGDLGAFRQYWNAPLFHPEPLALAYSEHLFAQAVQAAPLHAFTGNILLGYNLLFLSTFVLSGLGAYLLARELTGSGPAAFVGGLLYAFALYRVAQYPHLQALSSQWLPFVFLGLRRFFTTRRWTPLAGATLALIAQNLSNGYYLIFFAPFVAAYCVYEVADRRLWTDIRVLSGLPAAAIATAAATLPFLVPYLVLRAMGVEPRPLHELRAYSADLLAWVTAAPDNRLWGWLDPFLKAEGELFPGVVTILLAGTALAARARTLWRESPAAAKRWHAVAARALLVLALVLAAFVLLVMATGDTYWRVLGFRVTMRQPWRAWTALGVVGAGIVALSPFARRLLRGVRGSAFGFFAASAALSALLALGPVVDVAGTPTGLPGPYGLLYQYVPGFDGLRVPARYAMLTACCLAVLSAYGARALLARRRGAAAVAVLSVLFVVESTAAPIPLDRRLAATPYSGAPPRVYTGGSVPPMYRFAATLPPSTVLLELPLGSPAWDIQALFYQRVHRHPLVNGYSGGFPRSFDDNRDALEALAVVPEAAWQRVRRSGATHVLLHRAAYAPPAADAIEQWLTSRGATLLQALGQERLFALPAE
jgi:hypothetical protein